MSKPQPPCSRDCPRRSLVCHDPDICPEWGKYQDDLAAFHRARNDALKEMADVHYVRGRPDVLRRRKLGESK